MQFVDGYRFGSLGLLIHHLSIAVTFAFFGDGNFQVSKDFSLRVRGQQRLWWRGALADVGVRTVHSLRGVKHDAQGAHQSDGVSGGMGAHRADSARLGDQDA